MIANALDRKRRDIEREIAEFTAMKEMEFIAFEKQLRAADMKTGDLEIALQKEKSDRDNVKSLEGVERIDTGPGLIAGVRRSLDFLRQNSLVDISNQDRQHINLSNGNAVGGNEPTVKPSSLGATESHEREKEFQGLFTPSFLPLLDGSSRKHKDWPNEPSRNLSIQPRASRLSLRLSAPMPSSASFPPSVTISSNSPPTTRSLSSSVPREAVSDHDQSASRSDVSAGCLRSSLRDPTQPRSPKRVLFSLDNVVVSPSTSPMAQKKTAASQDGVSGTDDGPEVFETGATVQRKEESLNGGSWDTRSTAASTKQPSTVPAASKTSNAYTASSYQGSSGTGISTPHARNEADDSVSASLDEDDLFRFDEDLDREEGQKPEEIENSVASEDDEASKEDPPPSTTSPGSPHAGSLPIEIKWPARRDRR